MAVFLKGPKRHRFDVDAYFRMVEAGIVPPGGCELIDGEVVLKGRGEPYRFDVDEYLKMAELGLLPRDLRTELIDGEIFEMSPQGRSHAALVSHLDNILHRRFSDLATIRPQSTLLLRAKTAPEPDLALLRFREDCYLHVDPGTSDILLVVEVADSSLDYDRTVKSQLYAERGIVEYWLVDVNARQILVHRDPQSEGYRSVTIWDSGNLSPLAFPERSLSYGELFAPFNAQ